MEHAKSFYVPITEFTRKQINDCEIILIDDEREADHDLAREMMDRVFHKIKEYVFEHNFDVREGDIIDTVPEDERERNDGKYIWGKDGPEMLDYLLDDYGSVPRSFIWNKTLKPFHPFFWREAITHNMINYPDEEVRRELYSRLQKLPSGNLRAEYNGIILNFDPEECSKEDILNMNVPFELSEEEAGALMPGTIYF